LVIVYEANFDAKTFFGSGVITDLIAFKLEAGVIVANRLSGDLDNVRGKAFTRDLF